LIIVIVCGGALFLAILVYFYKPQYKSDEHEVPVNKKAITKAKSAKEGDSFMMSSLPRSDTPRRSLSLDRMNVTEDEVVDQDQLQGLVEIGSETPPQSRANTPVEDLQDEHIDDDINDHRVDDGDNMLVY
jgi:hypothetical protein